jgi:cell division protein FtsQ
MTDLLIGWQQLLRRWLKPLIDLRIPHGLGVAATALFLFASAAGVVCGDLGPVIAEELSDLRDATANAFGCASLPSSLAGQIRSRRTKSSPPLASPRAVALFLDAAVARARLKTNPWIVEASVAKLYPGRLQIEVTERKAFALWQKDRKISVISADGIVLEHYLTSQFASLPLVVGVGAERKARDLLALIDKYPAVSSQLYASVLVADRRWNLKLKNGLEILLPESPTRSAALRARRARPRQESALARRCRNRSAAAGPGDREAVGRSLPNARGRARAGTAEQQQEDQA